MGCGRGGESVFSASRGWRAGAGSDVAGEGVRCFEKGQGRSALPKLRGERRGGRVLAAFVGQEGAGAIGGWRRGGWVGEAESTDLEKESRPSSGVSNLQHVL